MASDSRGFSQLKKLAKEIPSEEEVLQTLNSLRESEGHAADRAAAIVGGAFIEHAITNSILSKFIPLDPKTERPQLFDPEKGGPLGSFAAKIRVAYAMGLFGPQTRDELDCIKAVRNAFAHGTLSLDFKTPQIMKICNHFSLYEKSTIVEGLWGNTAKDRYISTVAFVSSRLGANIIAKHKPRQPLRPRGLFSAFATARSWGQLS